MISDRRLESQNQRVERTAAERTGFDMIGFMNIIRHSLSARSAAVAHSGRLRKMFAWRSDVHEIVATWRQFAFGLQFVYEQHASAEC